MPSHFLRGAASAHALILATLLAPGSALAAENPDEPDAPPRAETIIITGEGLVQEQKPVTVEIKTADDIQDTTNVVNVEDSLRYFPNILVRKRHIGDTQAPITTRTSGVGASARSLIYADGVLLSALIGNNNNGASPKWGMVSPDEIAQVSVAYGPFSAAYPGNSIGAVVEIETRMPEKFEGAVNLSGSLDHFKEYRTSDDFGAWQGGINFGNRIGPVSFWFGATRTESDSQPISYVTATRPTAPSTAGTPVTGAVETFNRTGVPIVVLGEGGLEHQVQDNLKFKLALDVTPDTQLAWTIGRFGNNTDSDAKSYLADAAGQAVYSGGPLNINGYSYTVAPSAFSNGQYAFDERQWMNSVSLSHNGSGVFDWRVVGSLYDYEASVQRLPSTALPAVLSGGPGSVTRGDGTGWKTIDAKGVWRPFGLDGAHEISFGAHGDYYEFSNNRYITVNWISGPDGALASASTGKTETTAIWAQEAWKITPALQLVAGGRWESWKAFDGANYSAMPALNVQQPEIDADKFSPKASLKWTFAPEWSARVSIGKAYRFPTVTELYQSVTAGSQLTTPNPNLKPEDALSSEWSLERRTEKGNVRLTIFTENIKNALISQSATLDPATTTPQLPAGSVVVASFVQNVDKVRSRGAEIVAAHDDVLIRGLSLSGSITYVDSETQRDATFPAAVGKMTPQLPKWRSTLVATYRPDMHWAFTIAGRYSDRLYGSIDNSDTFSHTYQGFEGFMAWDVRINYRIDNHWSAAVGVENFGGANYFLFHPFPQRTATAELQYRF
jgi:iron complex outermembrane receptor protein